ncbi:GspE/PulE family protein [Rubripirellula reticaptiva]|uniref:Putative type II secretion system protein E n=1 Tax=Rubripirellula reticaptiva TaxID=2528013 RepID=A0A5C6EM33_9BACT|nr:ATPase, T2SS/T4P/T4SS family [Rubripirellula reticaptiva]TWU49404.1 putative type II secretion system protein E [Rubripirellula reticaptiva]
MSTKNEVQFEPLEGEVEISPPEMYAANLVEWAVERHASDLFISDSEHCVLVAIRRLGKIELVRKLARQYGKRLQGHLRVLAGADAGESIRPADGRGVLTTPNGSEIDLRLSSIPTLYGQDIAIRLFDPVRGARSIDKLGYDPSELQTILDLIHRPSGLVLVAGPVGSGKSSTLYSAVEALNDGTRKIHTLEDPIEHSLPGVMQSQVNIKAGLDFADLLTAVLRHSPDVIMVGEIRDSRTASTAVRAGASGQLVLATIHAKSCAEAVDAMLQYDTKPKFLAGALLGVINQRLLRQLCPNCRRPICDVDMDIGPRIGNVLGGQKPQLFEAVGCDQCFGAGFASLACVPEIMDLNHHLCHAIGEGVSAADLETLAVDEGMLCLAEVTAARVLRGETTADEANHAIADPLLATLSALAKRKA